ncbi:hypothetical protein DH86_00004244, partial [Scytalidium sp. 3C]
AQEPRRGRAALLRTVASCHCCGVILAVKVSLDSLPLSLLSINPVLVSRCSPALKGTSKLSMGLTSSKERTKRQSVAAPEKPAQTTTMGSVAPPFTLKDEPIENLRPLKVRVIGAGYSGIYLGIRIPQKLRNIDLKIYEKNDGVGGTWWENRYPGCACDIPAHSYQFSFDPNPNWSSFYAPAKEICAYLTGRAEKYGVMRFVQLSHKVTDCTWNENLKKW